MLLCRYSTPCLKKKTVQICFCQNFVKFTLIVIIFDRKMAKRLKLYEMHSFSTSPNSHHHTTMLNADVPKCYRTLKVDICNKLSNDLVHNKLKCGLFSRTISSYKVWLKIIRNCQNFCTNCLKNWMVPRNVLFAASRGWRRKCEAAFMASQEYVTVQRFKGLSALLSAIFSVRMFDPINLLNHVVPSIELMMQIWAIQY